MNDLRLSWDKDWLNRFDIQAPRYTSYPPANQFSYDFNEKTYRQQVAAEGAVITPLGLYVHIPFCRQNCFYCACNKIVTRDAEKVERFISALLHEITLLGALHGHRRIIQMHWGGGTPTYLSRAQITHIMVALGQHFVMDNGQQHDYSIEIDPRTVDVEDIALLRGLGFNRISMGIQDFDPKVQRLINRVQSFDQVELLTEAVRENGYDSLNFDLIYGLPGQTEQGFRQTLAAVIALSPDRIACYNYAHLPDKFPGQRGIDAIDLPAQADKLTLLQVAGEMLQAAGYHYLGMDHFAKSTDALAAAATNQTLRRNFQGYSTALVADNIALGPSAISALSKSYAQNTASLESYCQTIEKGELPIQRGYVLNPDDVIRKDVIMTLACQLYLDIEAFSERYGINFRRYFAKAVSALAVFEDANLLRIDAKSLRIQPQGRLVMRNILLCFDAFHQSEISRKIFSRAI